MRFRVLCCLVGLGCLLTACRSVPGETANLPAGETTAAAEKVADESVPLLPLVKNGKSGYVIIRAENADSREVEAVTLLTRFLLEHGLNVQISTDFKRMPVYPHEIIVGSTERESEETYLVDRDLLGESGFCAVMSGEKLYLAGGTANATYAAVEWFIETLLEPALGPDGGLAELSLPADYVYMAAKPRQITAMTLGGRPIGEYVIAAARPTDEEAARNFGEQLIKLAGVRLPVVSAADAAGKPTVLLSGESLVDKTSASFEEENLVFRYDARLGACRAADDFIAAELEPAKGEYLMTEVFRMETSYAITRITARSETG